MKRLALTLFVLGALAGAACADSFKQSARTVDRFDFVEITLTLDAPVAGDPFTEAILKGDFTPAGAHAVQVDGFCDSDDGRVFRIRFMPTTAGRHTYSLTFRSAGRELNHAGEFTARAGKQPGLVRVDREHPSHFIREGSGEHFFYNSTTAYWLLGFRDDAMIRDSIDQLTRLAFTAPDGFHSENRHGWTTSCSKAGTSTGLTSLCSRHAQINRLPVVNCPSSTRNTATRITIRIHGARSESGRRASPRTARAWRGR